MKKLNLSLFIFNFCFCFAQEQQDLEYFCKIAPTALKELYSLASQENINDIIFFNEIDRHKWIKEKAIKVSNNSKVLDVGCGACPYKSLFEHCDYKTQDFAVNKDHIKYGNIDFVSDITKIPVPDESFDVILCTEVFEHIPEPIKALQEIARILKPGGKLFLSAPLGSGLHQMPYHYYGGFTPEWYKLFCPKFNLKVTEIKPNGGFFKMLTQECGRVSWLSKNHDKLHGNQAHFAKWLFNDFLPRYLSALDEKCFIDGFTIGYHVEATKNGSPQKIESISTEFPFDELYQAIKEQNINKINELNTKYSVFIKKAGMDIFNLKDKKGYSPLMWTAENKLFDATKFLIDHGAKVNDYDKNKSTPLMFACWKGSKEIIGLLIKNNADTEAVDVNGTTALSLADKLDYKTKEKIISLLLGD